MGKEPPEVRERERIRVGKVDCVVRKVYPKGSLNSVCEVVFNISKPTSHDVGWDGKDWFFTDGADYGGYVKDSDACLQILRAGRS